MPLSRMQRNVSLAASKDTITPLEDPSPVSDRHYKQKEISSPGSGSLTSPFETPRIGHADFESTRYSEGKQHTPQPTRKSPFAFTPKQLAQLHDPKDLSVLRSMGGVDGLIFGLQTNIDLGLSPEETTLVRRVAFQDVERRTIEERQATQKRGGKAKETDQDTALKEVLYHHRPNMTIDDIRVRPSADTEHPHTSFRKGTLTLKLHHTEIFHDRHRIFSVNRIPLRKTKNVFQLMWSVLHDKVLVQPHHLRFLSVDTARHHCNRFTWFGILSKLST